MNEAAWCYLEGFGGKKDKVRESHVPSYTVSGVLIVHQSLQPSSSFIKTCAVNLALQSRVYHT